MPSPRHRRRCTSLRRAAVASSCSEGRAAHPIRRRDTDSSITWYVTAMRIDRVYTRGGDKGETSLIGGERVAKSSMRIECYGTVDETNATVGLVIESLASSAAGPFLVPILRRVQNELFNLGAELATASAEDRKSVV